MADDEHAYQAAKFMGVDGLLVDIIFRSSSAHNAKQLAKIHKKSIRPDWQDVKLSVMKDICRAKLLQHPYIMKTLDRTYGKTIVEDSPEDDFWGRGPNNDGQNHLGQIWMELRDEYI